MSYSNRWLHEQLRRIASSDVEASCDPLIRARLRGRLYSIYAPSPAEYIITVDVVQRVLALGGNTISYAKSWSRPSIEAEQFAAANNVEILPHGALLARFGGYAP
jgi:hypothetical protein